MLCVVGGFGLLTRDGAISKVKDSLARCAGFVRVLEERCAQVPKVIVCEFGTHAQMMSLVRGQKTNPHLQRLWVSPDRPFEDRIKFQRLFKAKRGIIEATKCDGDSIVVDKPSRKIYSVSGAYLAEVCHCPPSWQDCMG